MKRLRVLGVSTTTHDYAQSASGAMLDELRIEASPRFGSQGYGKKAGDSAA